jgi:hypothetical protein
VGAAVSAGVLTWFDNRVRYRRYFFRAGPGRCAPAQSKPGTDLDRPRFPASPSIQDTAGCFPRVSPEAKCPGSTRSVCGEDGSAPEQCDAFLREQIAVWGKVVGASGARAD